MIGNAVVSTSLSLSRCPLSGEFAMPRSCRQMSLPLRLPPSEEPFTCRAMLPELARLLVLSIRICAFTRQAELSTDTIELPQAHRWRISCLVSTGAPTRRGWVRGAGPKENPRPPLATAAVRGLQSHFISGFGILTPSEELCVSASGQDHHEISRGVLPLLPVLVLGFVSKFAL